MTQLPKNTQEIINQLPKNTQEIINQSKPKQTQEDINFLEFQITNDSENELNMVTSELQKLPLFQNDVLYEGGLIKYRFFKFFNKYYEDEPRFKIIRKEETNIKPGEITIYNRLINSVWFTECEIHEDKTVTIKKHDRDYMAVKDANCEGWEVEDKNRLLVYVTIPFNKKVNGEIIKYFANFPVRNQKGIFSYQ